VPDESVQGRGVASVRDLLPQQVRRWQVPYLVRR
jgi:hypothetical protein